MRLSRASAGRRFDSGLPAPSAGSVIHLIFEQRRIPRTTTRKERREMDRWRRRTQREFRRNADRVVELLREADLPANFRLRVIDRIVNPPVMAPPPLP